MASLSLGEAAAVPAAPAAPTVLLVASLTLSLVNFRLDLIEAIRRAGFRVVATAPDADAASERALSAAGVDFRRIPLARTGLNPLADLRYLGALARLMRETAPAAVIPYTAKPVIYAGLAARLVGCEPVFPLMTGLGTVFADAAPRGRARMLRAVTETLYRAGLKRARRVFVYNDADEADIVGRRLADPARIVRVAGSGVNCARFPAVAPPAGPPSFVLIARLLRDKGLGEYVAAARRLKARHPEATFRIVGPYDPNPRGVTAAEMAAWTADGAVQYCGPTADVRPFLAAATALVLPTYYREGVPRTILEALATGRAVITTDLPGCRETVEPGENGLLVPPRDVDALAGAMERLILDPALAAAMGTRSRALALSRWDVGAVNRTILRECGLVRP